ncbi:carbohydrate ABC transporter permease [Streptomonospora nanhaiensis]|uniref:Multiple sugar transport system permease protein n=1 Tax=Streptomonospora nanhaiensis TaxID=1323731 RepID=A0A853BP09_9ACTN|nr:sugar ABC transporter permease [Streptomonospora nanhaiensis]MBV2361928.1 sugar ABC transporter permease [Streptomonospora nanhaiensis]MBX9388638.1 sugar ABC transporter permease [Streptomonospora nanhaiensis]NYI96251.1 multiple sugar transport system permease protein [Streptomonospora nanhaiensis]
MLARVGFLAPLVVYLAVFFGYPLLANQSMALREYTAASFYTGEAPFVGAANYAAVLADPVFGTALSNTALFTVGSLVFQFAIGLALAVFFQRHVPLNGLLRSLLLVPWLLPLVVSGTVWRWIFDQEYGVLNQTLLGLGLIDQGVPWLSSTSMALASVTVANIWVGIPFNMVILYGGLQSIPAHLYEAAALDGAGPWQRFRHVTWPLLRPVSAVVLMLGLVYTLKQFDVIMVLTQGGPANATQTLTTWAHALSFGELDFGLGAAVGNLLIVIALVFALVYLRGLRTQPGAPGSGRRG